MTILRSFITKYKYQLVNLLAHVTFLFYVLVLPYYALTLIIGWIANNLFHYLYIHRIFTHKHFQVSERVHRVGLFFFSLLNLGSPPVYAAVHVNHHSSSGTYKDPHNPYNIGFFRAWLSLWDENFTPNRRVLLVHLKNPTVMWYHKNHFKLAIISVLLTPFFIVVSFWMSKIVIILVHVKSLGYANENNPDTSRNVWWLKPLTWGEELHNNHHCVNKPNHQLVNSYKEFDLLYHIGKLISRIK